MKNQFAKYQAYIAEVIGTFALTFIVWLSVTFTLPLPTPVMAALTLGVFVCLFGAVSGAHFNPAVTVGLLSIQKIKPIDALWYVASQFAGSALAMLLGYALSGTTANVAHQSFLAVGFAEAIGAFFLVFAVTNVVLRKMETIVAGAVIGGSLLLGICMASPFSNGILNPAVAFGIGSFGPMYVLGPIVGAICGAWAAKKLLEMA